jgi:hypothetical protein
LVKTVLAREPGTIEQTGGHLVLASILVNLPSDLVDVASLIGVRLAQLEPMRGGAFQAELDLPPGFWRVWPQHSIALWIGRAPDAAMPHIARPHRNDLDLLSTLLRLHRAGMWLQEASLVFDDGSRTHSAPLEAIISTLRTHGGQIVGIAGFWGDESGRALQAEIYRSGEIRAGSPTTALRWLETAYGLND